MGAVKVMHPQFAQHPDCRERFLQEARTAARLDHPGIVQVFDFGQARSLLYIVMEFILGDNLRKKLQDLRAARSCPGLVKDQSESFLDRHLST
jgi:serine/threonine protein kinase